MAVSTLLTKVSVSRLGKISPFGRIFLHWANFFYKKSSNDLGEILAKKKNWLGDCLGV
jgi:hypothetical protein